MTDAMRVTHLITRLVIGGAQENTLSTIRGLRARSGVEVNLISGPAFGPEGSLENNAREMFTDAPQSFAIIPELVRPVHPLKDFIALRKLENILRAQRPDIVHTHSGKAGILGRLAAKRAGVPIIIHHIHGPSFGPFQSTLPNLIFTAAERHAAKVTDHFFCSAAAMTQRYLAAGIARPENYTRIFSGFDLQPFLNARYDSTLRREFGWDENHFVIGKIARLFQLKGHSDLLRAFTQLLPQVPHARLLLVGDGILRRNLEQEAQSLGIADKVAFTGLVAPAAVPRYIGIMDCLAHLSYREALSRALPQALAAAKPVIAYDFDGADEICRPGETGFLLRIGDIPAATAALAQLARDPALRARLGKTGQAFVRENFSIPKMVTDQLAVYERLLAKSKLG